MSSLVMGRVQRSEQALASAEQPDGNLRRVEAELGTRAVDTSAKAAC
jgi:hypothetical protein